jgi:hypothetical protein
MSTERLNMLRLLTGFLLFYSFALANSRAQGSDPPWLDDLAFQISVEKACDVELLMNVREGELGEKRTYEARVRCADGRMFDATRIGEEEDFTFKTCDVQVC